MEKNNRQKAGHYEILGETLAKFELFEAGWNPYSRYLDVDKVDLIVRKRIEEEIIYKEIQVKYGKLYDCGPKWERELFDVTSWRFFKENEFSDFSHRTDFFFMYVLAHDDGYEKDSFIFPAKDFHDLIQSAIPSKDKRKVYISRSIKNKQKWYLRAQSRFDEITPDTCIDVSRYRRNFDLLNT